MKYLWLTLIFCLIADICYAGGSSNPGVQQYGVVTPGNCTAWQSAGAIKDAGSVCGGGGSPGGSSGQIQYNNNGSFGGIAPVNGNCLIGSGGAWVAGACSSGGSVSITPATPNIIVSPNPITGTGTIGITELINAQGTATPYTILSTDIGETVTHNKTTAVAVTLPQATTTGFTAGAAYTELNLGAGVVTVTPTTSTINGASSLPLHKFGWVYGISDGTNWVGPYFPGYDTITSGAMVKFSADTSGAFTAAAAGTDYQAPITLTTTGTSGAATFSAGTLNIPQYSSSTFQQSMASQTQLALGGL